MTARDLLGEMLLIIASVETTRFPQPTPTPEEFREVINRILPRTVLDIGPNWVRQHSDRDRSMLGMCADAVYRCLQHLPDDQLLIAPYEWRARLLEILKAEDLQLVQLAPKKVLDP